MSYLDVVVISAVVEITELGLICLTILGSMAILFRHAGKVKKTKACNCEFCGVDHDEKEEGKKD